MGSFASTVPLLLFLLLSQGEANIDPKKVVENNVGHSIPRQNAVTDICPKTMDPVFCLKTLKPEPLATAADLAGLASIIVELAQKKAKATLDLLTAASLTKSVNPVLKPIYQECAKAYTESIDNLNKAKPNIASKNYQLFADMANNALKGTESCEDTLKGSQAAPEIGVSNQETVKLCNMVFTCADQLLG